MQKHICWAVKQIYWSHVLGLDHSYLGKGLSVAFGGLAPMPALSSPWWFNSKCQWLFVCICICYPHMPIGKMWIYRLLFVCLCLCVCSVTDFFKEDKASGVKFCTAVHRRPRQGITHFGKPCSSEAQNRTNRPARDHLHDVHNDYPLAPEHMTARSVWM